MNFSFIFLLTLCPIEDLHVKLRCAVVIVEQQEEALMKVVNLRKTRTAACKVHLPIAIIINLNFIWRPFPRFFSKDGLTELSSIHESSKLQRHTLLFTALSTSESEKREYVDRRRRSILAHSGCIQRLAAKRGRGFGLVLTSQRATGCHFVGAEEDPIAMEVSLGSFLLP
jgi:hypothetical protein